MAKYDANKIELLRSDLGDGGWSLHVRRTDVDEQEDPARAWPVVHSGESDRGNDGEWERPDKGDWAVAHARARELAASLD
jgi:hypothetical protein